MKIGELRALEASVDPDYRASLISRFVKNLTPKEARQLAVGLARKADLWISPMLVLTTGLLDKSDLDALDELDYGEGIVVCISSALKHTLTTTTRALLKDIEASGFAWVRFDCDGDGWKDYDTERYG